MLQHVTAQDGSSISLPGIVPKLSRTPGAHRRPAPLGVGQDTVAVLKVTSTPRTTARIDFVFKRDFSLQDMGISDDQIEEMRRRGVLAGS